MDLTNTENSTSSEVSVDIKSSPKQSGDNSKKIAKTDLIMRTVLILIAIFIIGTFIVYGVCSASEDNCPPEVTSTFKGFFILALIIVIAPVFVLFLACVFKCTAV